MEEEKGEKREEGRGEQHGIRERHEPSVKDSKAISRSHKLTTDKRSK